jgi:NAD(P)H-nitrite reductase large subunit
MDGERDLSAPRGQQLVNMHPSRGVRACLASSVCNKSRGVATECTKFRDRKGDEADVGATPHPLRVLIKLGLMSLA